MMVFHTSFFSTILCELIHGPKKALKCLSSALKSPLHILVDQCLAEQSIKCLFSQADECWLHTEK